MNDDLNDGIRFCVGIIKGSGSYMNICQAGIVFILDDQTRVISEVRCLFSLMFLIYQILDKNLLGASFCFVANNKTY